MEILMYLLGALIVLLDVAIIQTIRDDMRINKIKRNNNKNIAKIKEIPQDSLPCKDLQSCGRDYQSIYDLPGD